MKTENQGKWQTRVPWKWLDTVGGCVWTPIAEKQWLNYSKVNSGVNVELVHQCDILDIYLDNGWYNTVHMNCSVAVGHKKLSQTLTRVDSTQLEYNVQQYNYFQIPMQVAI